MAPSCDRAGGHADRRHPAGVHRWSRSRRTRVGRGRPRPRRCRRGGCRRRTGWCAEAGPSLVTGVMARMPVLTAKGLGVAEPVPLLLPVNLRCGSGWRPPSSWRRRWRRSWWPTTGPWPAGVAGAGHGSEATRRRPTGAARRVGDGDPAAAEDAIAARPYADPPLPRAPIPYPASPPRRPRRPRPSVVRLRASPLMPTGRSRPSWPRVGRADRPSPWRTSRPSHRGRRGGRAGVADSPPLAEPPASACRRAGAGCCRRVVAGAAVAVAGRPQEYQQAGQHRAPLTASGPRPLRPGLSTIVRPLDRHVRRRTLPWAPRLGGARWTRGPQPRAQTTRERHTTKVWTRRRKLSTGPEGRTLSRIARV